MNSTWNSTSVVSNVTVTDIPAPSGGGGLPPWQPGLYTDAKELIWKIVSPIVVLLGTFGNGLTIVVLLRQVKNLSSTAVYLLTLAFSDLMILYLGPIRQWILIMWDTDVRLLTDAGCKTSLFFTYFSFQLSSWLLVAVTTERVISVMFPHKVKLGCTTMKAGKTVLIIIVCLAALNSHFFYGYGKFYIPTNPRAPFQCFPKYVDYLEFRNDILPWLDFVVAFALPFLVLTCGNILIIVGLKRQVHNRKKMSLSQTEKEGRSITVMLIMLCVVFFICLTPANIFFIILPYLREDAIKRPFVEMLNRMEFLLFIHTLLSVLSYINSATNFLLYFLSGSRFRAEVRDLFACRKPGKEAVFGTNTTGKRPVSNTRTKGPNPNTSITFAGKVIESGHKTWENRGEPFTDIKCANEEDCVELIM